MMIGLDHEFSVRTSLALPTKLLEQGVRDMVCISDGRMSGTAYGTIVLHVSPESAVGGPLALVQEGDMIALDVEERTLNMEVSAEALARRRHKHQHDRAQPRDKGLTQSHEL